jgi:hypothetical protein
VVIVSAKAAGAPQDGNQECRNQVSHSAVGRDLSLGNGSFPAGPVVSAEPEVKVYGSRDQAVKEFSGTAHLGEI